MFILLLPLPPIILFMLFMLIPLFSVLPIPELIILLMLPAGGAAMLLNDEDAETCLGAPLPGGGGKLNPVGVLVPFEGGGASEKEEL